MASKPRGLLLTILLLSLSTLKPTKKFHAEEPGPALSPRLAQAMQLAEQERRRAQASDDLPASTRTARSSLSLQRAQAWESALRLAASAILPQDADVLVTAATGSTQFIRGGRSEAPRAGLALREADELAVEDGRLELRFHDGSTLALGARTALRMLQGPRGFPQQSAFALDRGTAYWGGGTAAPGLTRVVMPRAVAQLRVGSVELRVDAEGTAWLSVVDGAAELSARPESANATERPRWWEESLQIKLDRR